MLDTALATSSWQLNGFPYFIMSRVIYSFISGIINNLHGWQTTRRFAMSGMRDFGVGKSTIEGRCIEEIDVLTREMMCSYKSVINANNSANNNDEEVYV